MPFPVVVIDDSPLKRLIENTYGVGPTVVEGFMRATNLLVAATTFCVSDTARAAVASRARCAATGRTVLVVERDPVRALEAAFDGMRVRELHDALPEADVVVSVTGTTGVIGADGARRSSATTSCLRTPGTSRRSTRRRSGPAAPHRARQPPRPRAPARPRGDADLTAATGNQIQVMDLGFALQAHSLRELARDPVALSARPQPVPPEVDDVVARAMLASLSASR